MYQTGTHGSMGGRLTGPRSASYPIVRSRWVVRRMVGERFLMLDTTPMAANSVTMEEPP